MKHTMRDLKDQTIARKVPVIDALIAESAKRIGAVILTLDPHFQMIPGIIAVDRIV